ncbi:unnamed protein product [Linum tenue]|uniref:Uncharacterized protein n=1 Tax=Linum tenue TaxID=586396 RepID=A0AAV0L7Z1_9ROSI|nr:unnamed protein product [Linum tenue]
MEKRLRSSLNSSVDDFLSVPIKLSLKSCKLSLNVLIHSISPSSPLSATLLPSLRRIISDSIASFESISQPPPLSSPPHSPDIAKSPPSKLPRRSSRNRMNSNSNGPLPICQRFDPMTGTIATLPFQHRPSSQVGALTFHHPLLKTSCEAAVFFLLV